MFVRNNKFFEILLLEFVFIIIAGLAYFMVSLINFEELASQRFLLSFIIFLLCNLTILPAWISLRKRQQVANDFDLIKSDELQARTLLHILNEDNLENNEKFQLNSICAACTKEDECDHKQLDDCRVLFDKEINIEKIDEESTIVLNPVQAIISNYTMNNKQGRLVTIQAVNDKDGNKIEKMITNSIFQAQERERKLISRELHDGVGQSLFGMLLQVDILKSLHDNRPEVVQYLDKLQSTLQQTIEDVRNLSSQLRPSTLDDFGLVATLRNFIQDFGSRFGIQINFTTKGFTERFPYNIETALYRIAQETLINAAKYSGAERIDILLQYDVSERLITMQITDFGKGFELNPTTRNGVGIYSMEERASILGGNFSISSEIGKGTKVQVIIPVE